jgi:hypothetical protein
MKLFKIHKSQEYGTEYNVCILRGKYRTFLQMSIGWDECAYGPYFQMSIGNNSILDILFYAHKFSFNIAIFSYTWNREIQ